MTYIYKTQPRKHQKEFLERTSHLKAHAVHWEMGTGKTKVMIDNIAMLFLEGEIDGALVVAPNGIDLNWIIDEMPAHLPDNVAEQTRICRFTTKSAGTKRQQAEVKWCREHSGLAWMLMSYDAFMTWEGKEAALKFLEQRKAFYILDESTRIKTPGAKRTKRVVLTAHRAKYRRTLTGTPMPNGAFDIYKQLEFLDENFWKQHGWDNFSMFKNYFGVFEKAFGKNSQEFEKLLGFRNLQELNKLIAPISSRVLKTDALDLPPKIYQTRWFELIPQQRKLYDELKEEFKVWLDSQTLVTANLAMVRLLRLQQISCGYLPVGEGEPVHRIEGKNPRLELLEEVIEDFNDKMIIWARYRLDIDLIADMLKGRGGRFVIYDGRIDDEELIRAKQDFQKGDAQWFVGNPAKGAEGITLHAAKTATYYSNSYNLNHRLQSEDRCHRDGLKHSVNYVDLLGKGTQDKNMLMNLCGKMNVSDAVLGDAPGMDIRSQLKNWLEE